MEITSFAPSKDRKTLNLVVNNASGITSALLFTNKTYKDYSLAIDLTPKFTGLATENIAINLADINHPYLDGLYFIEIESADDICTAMTSDTTRYRECILEKILQTDTCDECIKEIAGNILVAESLLTGVAIAVHDGYPQQAFNLVKALDKICRNSCNSCGDHNNVTTKNYFTTNSNIL